MLKRLIIIFLLGFSSGLPLALLGSTLQAWFASSGLSVFDTTMLSLLGLPYLYRVIWGPIVDRCPLFSLGKRRSWILSMQVLLLFGFNALAWFSPNQDPRIMTILAFFLACFSATQDVAIDAHRIEYLPSSIHGLGASIAISGYRIALMISGGLALIFASYWGFSNTYRMMGLLMTVGIFATLWSSEPSSPHKPLPSFATAFTLPLYELIKRSKFILLVLFIIFYKFGEAFTATTSSVVMPFLIQGLHFSLDTIGYVNKILGLCSIILGGFIAGFLLLRCSLYKTLMAFGLLQVFANLLFVMLASVGKNMALLAIAVVFENLATGMASTALVALFMRLVNQAFTGTQFSIFVAISTLPRLFSGPIAAFIEPYLGWVGLYQLSSLLAFCFIPFLMQMKASFLGDYQAVFLEKSSSP